jgi:hypothetical protein
MHARRSRRGWARWREFIRDASRGLVNVREAHLDVANRLPKLAKLATMVWRNDEPGAPGHESADILAREVRSDW